MQNLNSLASPCSSAGSNELYLVLTLQDIFKLNEIEQENYHAHNVKMPNVSISTFINMTHAASEGLKE